MISLHGEAENYALYTDGIRAVTVNKSTNMIDDVGLLSDLSSYLPWARPTGDGDRIHLELAASSLTDLSIETVTASAGRMYTIPKAAQEEAKRALEWRKEHKRGGTPVGLNTARTLAKGGQIGINKVRHIAKYFPRHEVDKRAKGYKPGQDGFPSNGRIAWALWGGDPAWRWAKQIVERENKKGVKASASHEYGDTFSNSNLFSSRTEAFEIARARSETGFAPEFAARVRLDGSGIDRLYMIDPEGLVFVWDDGSWDDLGHVDSDIATYDRSLDDPYDKVEKHHILIDANSALVLSAHLQEKPFSSVSVGDLDEEEANLVADAADEIDWVVVDSTLIAAGEGGVDPEDGEYTPEERSQKARRQVRDKSGKFSKTGSRVVVDGNASKTGNITSINPDSGTVSVKYDDGSVENVDARRTEGADTFSPTAIAEVPSNRFDTPLDTSGILAQPRAPIDRPNAYVPNGLPALTSGDLQQVISDFPAWVMSERQQNLMPADDDRMRIQPYRDSVEAKMPGDNAPPTQKSDYLKDLEEKSGKTLYTEDGRQHPLLQDFFKKKENNLWYSPITSAAEPAEEPGTDGVGEELTPETSDVEPMHLAIVSPDDPSAVMDLVSIVPATSNTTSPMTFKREDGKWVKDTQILSDLKSATPPPVVALDDGSYTDVLEQVDGAMTSSGYQVFDLDAKLLELYLADINPLSAAGGLDRNRGKAEKLRRYWLFGRGALKIRWNTPGDWTRCYRHLRKYMGPRAKGYCALRHKEATGVWPGSKYNVGKKKKQGRRGIRGSSYDNLAVGEESHVLAFARIRAALHDQTESEAMVSGGEIRNGSRFSIPLVIPEETETGDGRVFKKDSISIRELPLPLLWQLKTSDGHDGSVVVGRIDHMERTENGIGNAYGVFDTGSYGKEAERMIREGFIRGVSADLDKFEASEEADDEDEASKKDKIGGGKIKVDKARVMAVTIVPKPAFEECKIYINEDGENEVFDQQEDVMENVPDGVYIDNVDDADAQSLVACGMIASSIPTVPPAEWFADPKLKQATPLTVDDFGRVFGHIAAWNQDHIGMSYGTRPPRSRSKYAYFHTGVLRADDGKDYPVGQLTLAGGHASLEASAADAAKHYDDTGSAIADVHAGEDAFGIWVAGALRPSASPEQIRALRASAPSGDWRPIKGQLELVAVCQVNVPGFPIARARVASGQVYALVAAGAMTLAKMKTDPLRDFSSRLEELEIKTGVRQDPTVLSAQAEEARAKFAALREEKQAELQAKADELSSRVRSTEPYDSLGYISMRTRKKLAAEGKALPDGSYPIRNIEELKDAIQAYGRSKPSKRALVRRHIMKRARGLRRADLIPDKWKSAGLIDDEIVDDIKARVASAQTAVEGGDSPKALADALIATAGVIVAEERDLANALIEIANKYGKFNEDDTGIWAGYESAAENENAEYGVTCANCMLYDGGSSCKIIAAEVEPMGYCRFALIPDGIVKKRD